MKSAGGRAGTSPSEGKLTGKHVLMCFIGFFGVVFAVNGYFLKSALSTHSGVVSVEPYRKGLAYNERIAADERQTALGWRDDVTVSRDGKVVITMTSAKGDPVGRLYVAAVIGRPSLAAEDRKLELKEAAPGRYEAQTAALGEGNWILSLETRERASDLEPAYRARRRLWLKQ